MPVLLLHDSPGGWQNKVPEPDIIVSVYRTDWEMSGVGKDVSV